MSPKGAGRLGLVWANRSFRTKGMIVMAIPLAALVLVTSLSYVSERRAREAHARVARTLAVLTQIDEVRVLYLEATLRVRGYVLTGSADFLEPYHEAVDALPSALARLEGMIEADSVRVLSDEAELAGGRLLGVLEQLRASYRPGGVSTDRQRSLVLETRDALAQVRDELDAIQAEKNRLLAERQVAADRAESSASLTIGISASIGLLVGLIAMLLLARGVVRRVRLNEENARRLAEGLPLLPPEPVADEVGRVGMALQRAAGLLGERQAALTESEARYRALIRNFPNGAVALFDHELRFTLMDGKGLDVIGLSKETFEGKTLSEALGAISPENVRTAEPLFRAALRGESITMERPFGDRIFLVQYVPVRSERGEVIAGMLVALDITDRKRAEEEVRHTQTFLDSIVENIPNMVFVKSAEDLRFVRFNKAGEELLGFPRAELIGRNDYDFFPEDEADFFTLKDREVLEGKQLVDIAEEPIDTKSKGRRILHTKKIPILDEEGQPAYLLGISEDITERKLAEEKLRRAKDEAERADRAKDEFLSRMSHELRTPLNAVLGFAQILDMDELAEEQHDSVRQILSGGRHLLGLIDEVLDITRIATGKLPLSPEAVSVLEVLTEAADLIQPLATQRGIRVRVGDANGLHVLADRQRLKQVLLNLLSNGVKYNREGGEVAVTWERSPPDRLRIRIADTGVGIPVEVMERLFAPFDRLGAETSSVEGTGLGLALSKGLIEAMGGSIEAESEAGSGSVFTIELRLAEAPLQRYQRERPGGQDTQGDEVPACTILCIEDNLSNLNLIERIFAGRPHFRLLSAMQGSLGLELAREHRPDLILLDLHLPDVAGDEALQKLRQDPTTRRIPVVMISADATHGQIKRLLAAGADDYLTKPLDVKRFLETVDTVLQRGPSGDASSEPATT